MRATTELFSTSHQAAVECSSLFVPCCIVRYSTSLFNRKFVGAGLFLVNGLLANKSLNQEFTRFKSSEDFMLFMFVYWLIIIHDNTNKIHNITRGG